MAQVTEPTAPQTTRATARRPGATGGPGTLRRWWGRLPESLREALLPFVVARVVVAGTLGLAHFIVDRTHPSTPGWRPGSTRGCSAGTPAGTRRSPARATARSGASPLRFFPAVPLLTHAAGLGARAGGRPGAGPPGQRGGPGRHRHALRPGAPGDRRRRRRPPRPVDPQSAARRIRPGHGLRRVGPAGAWPSGASSPCGPRRARARPLGRTSPWPGRSPSPAALTRPIGVLLALAVAAELVRWWPRLGPRRAGGGHRGHRGPLRGRARVLGLVQAHRRRLVGHRCGSSCRARTTGGCRTPSPRSYHDATGVLHHHVGTALHVPWVLLAAGHARRVLAPAPGPLHALRRRRSWPSPWPGPTSTRSSATR